MEQKKEENLSVVYKSMIPTCRHNFMLKRRNLYRQDITYNNVVAVSGSNTFSC